MALAEDLWDADVPEDEIPGRVAEELGVSEALAKRYVGQVLAYDKERPVGVRPFPEQVDSSRRIQSGFGGLVSSAELFKFKLNDSGSFQIDMGHERNGHEVYSSLHGTCDAGQLLAIGKKAGFSYSDIMSGVDFTGSAALPDLKKFLVASASFQPVSEPAIKRSVSSWVISGRDLDRELERWGLSNPGRVFSDMQVLGVDLDGKGDLKVPVASGKRPVKSGFGGDTFSVLVSEVGPDVANGIKEWWINDGGESGPDALFNKLSEVFGEVPTESFVDALENQFFEELEGGMGGPSPVGSSHKSPVRSDWMGDFLGQSYEDELRENLKPGEVIKWDIKIPDDARQQVMDKFGVDQDLAWKIVQATVARADETGGSIFDSVNVLRARGVEVVDDLRGQEVPPGFSGVGTSLLAEAWSLLTGLSPDVRIVSRLKAVGTRAPYVGTV
jgi:hypothetical protein